MRYFSRRRGMTLVELLVVVAIIGLLMQLTLPAVEMARESARRAACVNNLKQIALAMQLHHDTHNRLPSGGWNYDWAGEPEIGTDRNQPGSWVFNLLDFLEESTLRKEGANLKGMERAEAIVRRSKTPISLFNCPSRRLPRPYPMGRVQEYYSRDGTLPLLFEFGAKTDYAACVGSLITPPEYGALKGWKPPKSLAEANAPDFVWPNDPQFLVKYGYDVPYNGVVYGRSEVRFEQITDGLSKVYLVGEKYVPVLYYKTGLSRGDNEHMYAGFNNDVNRSAWLHPGRDDEPRFREKSFVFGSAHPITWNMSFADGSVRSLSYDVYLEIHRHLGGRDDGTLAATEP